VDHALGLEADVEDRGLLRGRIAHDIDVVRERTHVAEGAVLEHGLPTSSCDTFVATAARRPPCAGSRTPPSRPRAGPSPRAAARPSETSSRATAGAGARPGDRTRCPKCARAAGRAPAVRAPPGSPRA